MTESKPGVVRLNGKYVALAHTVCAYSAFAAALVTGYCLHFEKIVRNAHFGYPDEWFPSVSATIGDRYPERSIFQILIALTSGPRFMLLFLNYMRLRQNGTKTLKIALVCGIVRTVTCGGWVYITSTDDHDWHDIFMISYIILTLPYTICISTISDKASCTRKGRAWTAVVFFATIVPLVFWFIKHKVHREAGAYTVYAFFEWSLIILDVAFDAWSITDLKDLELIVHESGVSVIQDAKPQTKSDKVKTSKASSTFTFCDFVVDTVNAVIFWSVLSSLYLCVWYFPLWHMGISGYEAVIIVTFIGPLILGLPIVGSLFKKFLALSRLLAVIFGVGAFKVADPEKKLIGCALGTMCSVISISNELKAFLKERSRLNAFAVSNLLGLLVSSVLKFANYSNNPIWPVMHKENGGWNGTGIFVGLTFALWTGSSINTKNAFKNSEKQLSYQGIGSKFLAALGFGAYMFSINSYLSDSHTLITWSWNGYPVEGPTAISGAIPHFLSFALGILASLAIDTRKLTSIPYNLVFGGLACFVLYQFDGWFGFLGACGYCFYLASLAPIIVSSISDTNNVLWLSFGFFVYTIFSLASTWIVAYAFVPMGWVLRERTDIVLFSSYLTIALGVVHSSSKFDRFEARISHNSRQTLIYLFKVLSIISTFVLAATINRYPTSLPTPFNAESQSFTAGIWCVHFGLDNDMWSSEVRMRDLISDAEVDIIGLLESDTQRMVGGNRDFTQRIAEDLGMYVDYGPGPNKHTWGAALLSKFPIINSTHHLLPSPVGELAPAIHATLDIYGELVDVIVFHSGQEEDVEDRRLQSLGIAEIAHSSSRPLVLLGYLVTKPQEGNYNTYVSQRSGLRDIDSTDWDRWCEYILFKDLKKVAYARISRSTITDTELQIAKFKLLTQDEKETVDEDLLYGDNFVPEEEVELNLRMPHLLRGDGVRGHRYHVFDEPRYFAQQ